MTGSSTRMQIGHLKGKLSEAAKRVPIQIEEGIEVGVRNEQLIHRTEEQTQSMVAKIRIQSIGEEAAGNGGESGMHAAALS